MTCPCCSTPAKPLPTLIAGLRDEPGFLVVMAGLILFAVLA